ncbi:hypothetical protein KDW_39460 [Dictyobacter vulcani]|uniref:HTH cro/C1-type domain-containing protein n=1 Tax=Dictyobacter vulcani TaxID=2607529 RepID=A0A5J4KJW4_9CHLR|nr:helix-turn-helix transcriptional regulator [Dictyobacter vulcani]GER89784.1 hypothetical protein KDW_39460 [Dictyobacter vulcani]
MRGRKEEALTSRSSPENELGTVIRAWRHVRGLSVTDLAVAAGFGKNGRGYISRIEHGQIRHLGEERLLRLANALHLQRTDLLLHRMPEMHEKVPMDDLDAAILGGKILLKTCTEQSFDWARLQLLLARLYCERADTLCSTTAAKHTALIEAHQCIERALQVFTAHTARKSFEEATQLGREIDKLLYASIIESCLSFIQRCPPQSLDCARFHMLHAQWYRKRATSLPGFTPQAALIEAQQCLETAIAIFTQKQAQNHLQKARQLHQEIMLAIQQVDLQ